MAFNPRRAVIAQSRILLTLMCDMLYQVKHPYLLKLLTEAGISKYKGKCEKNRLFYFLDISGIFLRLQYKSENLMVNWKVLFLQSKYEFAVEKQLAKMGIEHYLPKICIYKKWSDRVKKQVVPAFPSYIFVKTEAITRNNVFQAKGVLKYVKLENQDASLSESTILLIKNGSESIMPMGFCCDKYQTGQRVMITGGSFMGQVGRLVEKLGKHVVRLELSQLQMGFYIDVPSRYLDIYKQH